MSEGDSPISPRIASLVQALESGSLDALDRFWREISKKSTPLVEPIEDDDDHSLVTFLWRSDEISSISIISLLTSPTTFPMTRLLDTDLWYMTCRVRNDVRTTYQFSLRHPTQTTDSSVSRWANWHPDPLNPKSFAFYTEDEDPTGVRLERSILELEGAPEQAWIARREGVPSGEITLHYVRSEILGNKRRVWIYTPPGYTQDRNDLYDLLILFDGWGYLKLIPTSTILDNLISADNIPPIVAAFMDSLSIEERMRELVYHEPFNDFLIQEFLPWIDDLYHVTNDPGRIMLGGSSAGGLAATYAALEHPEAFGNVLSQSGAFRLAPAGEDGFGWLADQFAARVKLPLRFHLDVGLLEENSLQDLGGGPSLLQSTRHLRDVLRDRGYNVHYMEFSGGHDYISWQGTISEGLQALLGENHTLSRHGMKNG